MAPSQNVRGGCRRCDCIPDGELNEITNCVANNPLWRVGTIVLQNIPLRTGVLLVPESLETQMKRGLGPCSDAERTHFETFARALDADLATILTQTQNGLAQQTVRIFGVHVPPLKADRPLVDPGNFLALSQAAQKPASILEGTFDILIKMLLFDHIAKTKFSSPPPPPTAMVWKTALVGTPTAEFFLTATDDWVKKLEHVLDVFKASPEGQRLRARTDGGGYGSWTAHILWGSKGLPEATRRLAKLAERHREGVLGALEFNLIFLAHLFAWITTPFDMTGSLATIKRFREALEAQTDTEETALFIKQYLEDSKGIMLAAHSLLAALCISPVLLATAGRLDRKPAFQGFELFAILQRARAAPRSEALQKMEDTLWNAALNIGVLGMDSTSATMQALDRCCDLIPLLESSDANVFANVCSRGPTAASAHTTAAPQEEEEEEDSDGWDLDTFMPTGNPAYPMPQTRRADVNMPAAVAPADNATAADLSAVLNTVFRRNAAASTTVAGDFLASSGQSISPFSVTGTATSASSSLHPRANNGPTTHLSPSSSDADIPLASPQASAPTRTTEGGSQPNTPSSVDRSHLTRSQAKNSSTNTLEDTGRLPRRNRTHQPIVPKSPAARNPRREPDSTPTTSPSYRKRPRDINPAPARRSQHSAPELSVVPQDELQVPNSGSTNTRGEQENTNTGDVHDAISATSDTSDDEGVDNARAAALGAARVEQGVKTEEVELHWLESDDEVEEVNVPATMASLPENLSTQPLCVAIVKALSDQPDPIEVEVPIPSRERETQLNLYKAYSLQFEASSNASPGEYPCFIKLYDVGSWSASWSADTAPIEDVIEKRNVVLIKGSSDGSPGILQQSWGWSRRALSRVVPGVRHIEVQDYETIGPTETQKGRMLVTLDQFLAAGEKGYALRILDPPPLSESPETLPYSRIFSSHRQALDARRGLLRELSSLPDMEPENENDRDLYGRIRHNLGYATAMHRGASVPRHIAAGGASTIIICATGALLCTVFDPRNHDSSDAGDICDIHFGHNFNAADASSVKGAVPILVKAGDALILPPMAICSFAALQDSIMVVERFIWHGNIPDGFCAFVMSMLDPKLADSTRLELLSVFQSFASSWGSVCTSELPLAQEPSYPNLDGPDADVQLLKLLVIVCTVVFSRALSLGKARKRRPLLGSRKLDQLHIRQLWVQLAQSGYAITCGKQPADSVEALSSIIGDRFRQSRVNFCGLAAGIVYVGHSLVEVTETVERRVGPGRCVKRSSAMYEDVVADLREALYWPDHAVKHMLESTKSAHTGKILPQMAWQRRVSGAHDSESRTKPLLWRSTAGNTKPTVEVQASATTKKVSRPRTPSREVSGDDLARGRKRARFAEMSG